MSNFVELTRCLACDGARLKNYLDLGNQPLANDFRENSLSMQSYPLGLQVCLDCWHSQLTVSVNPEILFRDYLYVSGTTKTLMDYFEWFGNEIISPLGSHLAILDIASNDGSLLEVLTNKGHVVLGVDPAANLIPLASRRGVATICDFWPGVAASVLGPNFDVVIAMNVLAHVPDPAGFLSAILRVLKPDAKIFVQTSQANMVVNSEFDTAYHEHLSFFNTNSMKVLANRAGLNLIDAFHTPIHGTSYVWVLKKEEEPESERLNAMREAEELQGIFKLEAYLAFRQKAEKTVSQTIEKIDQLRKEGYKIWGYGAAAKGNTFINFSGIVLEGVFDDNPLKQNLVSPGGGARVLHPAKLADLEGKICVLVPAWNFLTEISRKIRLIRDQPSDLVLTYYPEVMVSHINDPI